MGPSNRRPSSWTPDIPGSLIGRLPYGFRMWRPIFWTGVWVFIVSAVAVGVRLVEVLP